MPDDELTEKKSGVERVFESQDEDVLPPLHLLLVQRERVKES